MDSEGTPDDRVRNSLYGLGLPIVQGAVSTILGVIGLMIAPSYIFVTFFKMVFLVIFAAFLLVFVKDSRKRTAAWNAILKVSRPCLTRGRRWFPRDSHASLGKGITSSLMTERDVNSVIPVTHGWIRHISVGLRHSTCLPSHRSTGLSKSRWIT